MRPDYQLSQLDVLEAEAVHVMREVAAEFERPVMLFSGGKDSIVLLRLAEKWESRLPKPHRSVLDRSGGYGETFRLVDPRRTP